MKRNLLFAGLALGAVLWALGCSGGSSSTSSADTTTPTSGIGAAAQAQLIIGDAPLTSLDNVAQINITVTKIDLLFDGKADSLAAENPTTTPATGAQAGQGDTNASACEPATQDEEQTEAAKVEDSNDTLSNVFTGSQTINLLDLANKPVSQLFTLSTMPIPSGHYKQVRLTLDNDITNLDKSNVTLTDGTKKALKVPSGVLKVRIDLMVQPNTTAPILLDFDLSAPGSLLAPTTGRDFYVLTPRLRTTKVAATGQVIGNLQFTGTAALPARLIAFIDLTPTGTTATAAPKAGERPLIRTSDTHLRILNPQGLSTVAQQFIINCVAPGTYAVVVHYADQIVTPTPAVADVTVTAGQQSDLGTVNVNL